MGYISRELNNWTSLTTLQLDKNQLSGPIPMQIGELKYLQSFFLWGNFRELYHRLSGIVLSFMHLISQEISLQDQSGTRFSV
ncbi:probable LRR receptor-like serine threonine-kinase At1g34110, partial [Olea europaea subsp. europaea]